jgi:hypothetical protein
MKPSKKSPLRRIWSTRFPKSTPGESSTAGSSQAAFLAVPEGESQDALESSLTYGLLWLEKSRQSAKRAALAALRLILPKGKSAILANRLRALVYLIAPALRFHPTTDILLRYLSRDMEIIRVGIAESWRRRLRVMFRQ